eukprot:2958140-Pleurochrysis_carterae.AAC.1
MSTNHWPGFEHRDAKVAKHLRRTTSRMIHRHDCRQRKRRQNRGRRRERGAERERGWRGREGER